MAKTVELSGGKGEITFDKTLCGTQFFIEVRDKLGRKTEIEHIGLKDLQVIYRELYHIVREAEEHEEYLKERGVDID